LGRVVSDPLGEIRWAGAGERGQRGQQRTGVRDLLTDIGGKCVLGFAGLLAGDAGRNGRGGRGRRRGDIVVLIRIEAVAAVDGVPARATDD
jgi:hypothetical protein